jgi:hypothetical protein
MRGLGLRFTVRSLMLTVAAVSISLWAIVRVGTILWPADPIIEAAKREVPGIIIESVRAETFNQQPAWDVRGIDPKGAEWIIDVSAESEVLCAERVAYGPPRSEVVPYGR